MPTVDCPKYRERSPLQAIGGLWLAKCLRSCPRQARYLTSDFREFPNESVESRHDKSVQVWKLFECCIKDAIAFELDKGLLDGRLWKERLRAHEKGDIRERGDRVLVST